MTPRPPARPREPRPRATVGKGTRDTCRPTPAISMKASPSHFKRYREIAALLWKYGRSDLAQQIGTDDGLAPPPKPDTSRAAKDRDAVTPDQLADDLEAMGPTYVKFGQVLAGRPDLLPESYRKALARL